MLPPAGAGALPSGHVLDALLAGHGLTPPRSAMAQSPEDVGSMRRGHRLSGRAQIMSPDATHKTEVGGVALGLADSAAVEAAAHACEPACWRASLDARLDGFLIRRWCPGLQYVVGRPHRSLYGPFLVLGLGGVTVEVLKDIAIALLPSRRRRLRAC